MNNTPAGYEITEEIEPFDKEKLFDAILDIHPGFVAVLDHLSRVVYGNKQCQIKAGQDLGGMRGREFCAFFPYFGSAGETDNICLGTLTEHDEYNYESMVTNPGESQSIIAWCIQRLPLEPGTKQGYFIARGTDITAREGHDETGKINELAYRSGFASFQDVYYQTDLESTILVVSPSIESYGHRVRDLIGRSALDLYHNPDDRKRLITGLEEKGRVDGLEIMLKDGRGNSIDVTVNAHYILDDAGKPRGVEGVLRDISSRKRIERALRESEENTRTILDAFSSAAFLLDLEGTIIELNEMAAARLGRTIREATGTCFHDYLAPDMAATRKVRERNVVSTGAPERFENTLKGHIYDVTIYPVMDPQGRVYRLANFVTDITEQKKALIALQESERKIRSLLEMAPVGIIIIGKDRRIVLMNANAEIIFGYKKQELIGQLVDTLIPARFQETHVTYHESYSRNPNFRPMLYRELWGLKKDSTEVPLEIALSHVETTEGKLYMSFAIDITEKKRMEAELSRTRQEFIAMLTHDLKNPLSSIMGFSDLLERSVTGALPGDNLAYIGMIRHSGDIMLNLINNIVSSAKIDSGKMIFNFENFDLAGLFEDLKKIFSPLFQQRKITFTSQCPEETVVNGDRVKLRQVFDNLLMNAFRFTPQDGSIGLVATPENDRVNIEVFDTGKGIAPEEQGMLFRKFAQVKGEKKGTGLGLYIVKYILNEHGATVTLQSEPGKGTHFFFSLPGPREL
jgi:PAS domain S-box-containing protein